MLKKRIAFRLLALVNLISAYEWHLEGLGIGASMVSCAVAGIFLYCSVYRRKLKPLPAVGATPKQKAEWNLLKVALLVGAEEVPGGWQLHADGERFTVYESFISCAGKGQTCYQLGGAYCPKEEKMATALLFLSKYPQAWQFWAAHHGVRWTPGAPPMDMQGNVVTVG